MKGPSLSTATALLLLVLFTTAETAILKPSTSGTVPRVTKASATVPSVTKASATVPSVTKASATVPRTSTNKPSTVASPSTSAIAAQQEQPETGSRQKTQPAEDHEGVGAPSFVTPSIIVTNETLCPETCTCDFKPDLLVISDCGKDPSYPEKQLTSIFDKYPNTTRLVIKSSQLTYLPPSVCHLKHLRYLKLDDNKLDAAPWECLRGLRELRHIILSYNHFTGLSGSIPPSLAVLSVDNNRINYIDRSAFRRIGAMPHLKAINLQSNRLTSIDSWPLLGKQAAIHLDYNQISSFTNNDGLDVRCNAKASYNISLTNNNISRLTDMFNGWGIKNVKQQMCVLNKSGMINLKNNLFICDCVDYDIYRSVQKFKDSFGGSSFCYQPENFYGQRIQNIDLDQVSCSIQQDCPDRCHCSTNPSQLGITVNCSALNMAYMPDTLPALPDKYSYNLDFSWNKFELVDNKSYFHLVKNALFRHNAIGYFSKDALLTLGNVTELDLSNNQLLYLPEKILGVVNMTDSLQMKLAKNEWICDCYAKETRKWLLKMGDRIVDKDSIICNDPKDVKGRNMLQMRDDELKCGYIPKTKYMFYFGIGVATVAVWMVILGIPTGILYANRLTLFRKYGWHMFNNDECYGEFKEFDIFLAYAEVNVDYAMEKLFVELENKGYKVAYHRINFIGGKPIKVNIEECIRKSKRTITVISKRFFDSEWCRCELMTALDIDKKQNTKRQIGILLEEVDDVPELDPKVKKFLKTDHCLRLGEDLFEDKMEYMLARKKLKDQKHRRPNLEQLRTRQHRPRQPPANAANGANAARNLAENPRQPAAAAAAAAAAANQPAVLNTRDTAHLIDNEH